MRRSHGGIRASRATSSRSGSGPPSMSSRPPREPSTRIASPCPTSRTETRGDPGRAAPTTTAPATTTRDDEGDDGAARRRATGLGGGRGRPCGPGRGVGGRRPAARSPDGVRPASPDVAATTTTRAVPWRSPRPRRRSNGGPSVTLANGRPAAVSTIATTGSEDDPAGRREDGPDDRRAAGDDQRAAQPARRRRRPSPARRAGRRRRLTAGDRIASRPNETRTIGSVAAWAASETPRLSASQRGTRPPPEALDPVGRAASPRRSARRSPATTAGTRRRR